MKTTQQKAQLILLSIGILLVVLTYFYYPNLKKDKINEKKAQVEKLDKKLTDDKSTTFENVEYKGLYDFDKPFTVGSEKAFILNEEPDIVHMTNMNVNLYLTDGRIVNIVSDEGVYNKANYDCFFRKNVIATDGETEIFAENLDLLAAKSSVEVYTEVRLYYANNSLQADKLDYDFETKNFKVSMFDDKMIKMKVVK